MAATASEMPVSSISKKSLPCRKPKNPTERQMIRHAAATKRPSCFKRSCKGVGSSSASSIMPAILPISVCMPVAVTTHSPRPLVTMQPMHTASPACFCTGRLSPVSIDSLHERRTAACKRPSAAILSPSSSSSTSPGTTVRALTSRVLPPRRTRAVGAESSFSASSVFSVRYSCKKPITAFISTMRMIVTASVPSPIQTDTSVAAARIRIITSLNCEKNIAATPAPCLPVSRFSPTSASLAFACSSLNPAAAVCCIRFSPFVTPAVSYPICMTSPAALCVRSSRCRAGPQKCGANGDKMFTNRSRKYGILVL